MAAGDETRLTEQQRRAIATRNVSVALSAGAGCGKTFVLTERFLAQLEPQAAALGQRSRLGQLVAITFTERAAREMRQRIRAACDKRLIEAPEQDVDDWLELIRELDSARISTIHSFCGSLLRCHAVEARLDPQFRVLDQTQADTLLYELLDEQLRARLAERGEAVIELVVLFGLDRLHEMVRDLLVRRQEIDWAAWRRQTAESLTSLWSDSWRNTTVPGLLRQIARSPAARTLLETARQHPPSHAVMRQRCDVLVERIVGLPKSSDSSGDLAAIREAARVQGGGGPRVWDSTEVYAEFRDAASTLRKAIEQAEKHLAFDPEAALPAAEAALRLLGVAADVAEVYDARKQELGALDFNDLLIRARQLLVGPQRRALRQRLASQIRLLLVDEFQDTDPLQVELVEALCGDETTRGKLFFVGDYKQSIYRFRGAQPHVFRKLRDSIPEAGRLPLSLNFRSQPAVLDFVNALFREEMGPEYEPLRPHRPQVGPTPAVEMLWATDEAATDQGATDDRAASDDPSPQTMGRTERLRRREADWIARRIRAMLEAGEKLVWDEAAGEPAARAVRPGDVALLFRALSHVEYYEEALRRYGIDYYLVGGHAFYAQQEIFDVVNLLRALDSPCDEVSLAGALRSPFFCLWDETLFWLTRRAGGLGAALHAEDLPAELDPEQRRRAHDAASILGELRAMKDRMPIAQLIHEALERTGYDAIVLAEFLGERKLANLYKLIDQARSFDRSGIFTLSDFITQVSQFVARQPDEALAATHPESTDVVRLMTIHQSKGLEFPVVVVPDLDRRTRGPSSAVAFTPQLGPMIKMADVPSGFDLHALAESEEQLAELVRLLYVATTRAADYLILAAGTPNVRAAKGPWMELIRRRFDPETGAPRAAAGSHLAADTPGGQVVGETAERGVQVRVTLNEPPLASRPSDSRGPRNLTKLEAKARQMANSGAGRVPEYLAAVEPDRAARQQYSFSRLTGQLHRAQTEEQPDRLPPPVEEAEGPSPAEGPRLSATDLGTLVHLALAEIDFRNPPDVPALVHRHARRQLLDDRVSLEEPVEIVARFLASSRAAEIAAARRVHAELEFLLAWPPGRKEPDGPYLQGFIDCLYRDAAGDWHLLDYKTNRVTEATVDRVAAGYEMQMLLYALAVERISGKPPVELTLHFLRLSREHRFSWDAAARERVVGTVDLAIQGLVKG
ncbi:MAG: UvrD-helicase domain-containing protein [Pirellulales bacterium]|nr:UvrD-helicase domain-containing protein [Pirellulales bacterium]